MTEPKTYRTRYGDVTITRVQEGEGYVEVWGAGQLEDDPARWRIHNPPTLVEDPSGEIERHGKRWREDPEAALAEVIGQHGGATAVRHGRRARG